MAHVRIVKISKDTPYFKKGQKVFYSDYPNHVDDPGIKLSGRGKVLGRYKGIGRYIMTVVSLSDHKLMHVNFKIDNKFALFLSKVSKRRFHAQGTRYF